MKEAQPAEETWASPWHTGAQISKSLLFSHWACGCCEGTEWAEPCSVPGTPCTPELWHIPHLKPSCFCRCLWDVMDLYQLMAWCEHFLNQKLQCKPRLRAGQLKTQEFFSHYYFLILTSGIKKRTLLEDSLDGNIPSIISFPSSFLLLSTIVWALGHGWIFCRREGGHLRKHTDFWPYGLKILDALLLKLHSLKLVSKNLYCKFWLI